MSRVAIVLHADGDVAPVDDVGRHFDIVKVFEVNGDSSDEVEFVPDPKANDFILSDALRITGATDVIGQHFEEACFDELKRHGIHMWLEAPDFDAPSALQAWRNGKLPEATVGAHAVHGPEGRRTRHEAAHSRHDRHEPPGGDRGVHSPIEGGKTPF